MWLRSGGEVVAVDSELAWGDRLVARATGGSAPTPEGPAPTVRVRVEADTTAFDRTGLRLITRGGYGGGRRAVLHNAGGSGFDLMVLAGDPLTVTARYLPSHPVRAANRLLAQRFGLLAGQLAAGAVAISDNLCCADTGSCFGVAEPVRTDAPAGRAGTRTSRGRTT